MKDNLTKEDRLILANERGRGYEKIADEALIELEQDLKSGAITESQYLEVKQKLQKVKANAQLMQRTQPSVRH